MKELFYATIALFFPFLTMAQNNEGEILFQTKCQVLETDSALDVANKIHLLEQQYFPAIIEKRILG